MKTRPKPSLSLREIYESVIDARNHIWTVEQQQSLQNVFVALAVGLEDVITQQGWTDSDVDDLQIKLEAAMEAEQASIGRRDKRLSVIEHQLQIEKYPNMLKTGGK